MKTLKKIGTIAVSVVLWIVILLAALFAFTTLATKKDGSVSNFLGYTPLTVQSPSMEPTFYQGDLIIIKTVDPSTLKEGDIITFHTIIMNEYALNTHRIFKIDELNGTRTYTTRGDNNPIEDSHQINNGDIVGKYVGKVPFIGKVMDFLSKPVGFLLIIVLPMLAFFVYQIYHLVMVSISLKKATALEAAEEAAKLNAQANQAQDAELAAMKAEAEAAKAEMERLKAEAAAMKAEAERLKAEAAQGSASETKAPTTEEKE